MIKVGLVIKRYRDATNCDVRIEGPGHGLMKTVRIEDLAHCSLEKHSKSHQLLIPINHEQRLLGKTEPGYKVLYDPPADGKCQLFVVAYALGNLEIFRSTVARKEQDLIALMFTCSSLQIYSKRYNILDTKFCLTIGTILIIMFQQSSRKIALNRSGQNI